MQNQYFQLQKKINNVEERENSLCAKEKAFEVSSQNKDEYSQVVQAMTTPPYLMIVVI